MSIIYKWTVYCINEATDVSVWSETEPTVCPNPHATAIQAGRTRITDSRTVEQNLIMNPDTKKVKTSVYQKIAGFYHIEGKYILWKVKLNSYLKSGTSYDVKVIDITNNNALAETNFTNTAQQNNDIGTLTNVPTTDAEIEVHLKVNGGGGSQVDITGVNFLFTQEFI